MEPLTPRVDSVVPANIDLGWKLLKVTNALAYYILKLITVVKSFLVRAFQNGLSLGVHKCN